MEFAEASRRALRGMRHVATGSGHDAVGTGHLLLALLDTSPGLLRGLADPIEVSDAVRRLLPPGAAGPPPEWEEIPLTERMRTALETAMTEARDAGRAAVSPEDLIVGVVLEGHDVGARALRACGIREPAALR
jgi:ATP-dependent Clp protease ATP-binding subunit ClpA